MHVLTYICSYISLCPEVSWALMEIKGLKSIRMPYITNVCLWRSSMVIMGTCLRNLYVKVWRPNKFPLHIEYRLYFYKTSFTYWKLKMFSEMDSIFKHIYGKHFKCLLTNFTIIFILPFWIYFNHSLSEWFKRKRWIINRLQRKLVFIWRNLFKGTGFLCKGQPIFNANSFKHDTSFEQPVIWLRVYIKVPKACYRNMR